MLVLRWPLSLINILPNGGADDALLGPLFGRTGGCQHPAAHHADSIANAQQLGQIRTNKEDSLAGGGQLSHQPVNLRLASNVDATRWLVQQQDFRFVMKQSSQGELLLIPAG